MDDQRKSTCQWTIRVPVFRHPLILKQLALAIGLPFGLIILVLVLTAKDPPYLWYALGFIGLILVLGCLTFLVVFRGTYDVEFAVSEEGAWSRMQEEQARKGRRLSRAAVLLGLFARNYSAVGAGLLAQSRQSQRLTWGQVRKVSYRPKSGVIILRAAPGNSMVLFCPPDSYARIEEQVRSRVGG